MKNHWRSNYAHRRGDGQSEEHLDDVPEPAEPELSLAEQAHDRDWARAVLSRALTALEESYRARGRETLFAAVKAGLLRTGGVEDAAEVAERLGIPEGQVRLPVHRARQRLAEALRREVSATLENAADADDEVRHLLGVFAHGE